MSEFILNAYFFTTANLFLLVGILLIRRNNNLSNVILAMFILMHAIVFVFNLLLFLEKINPSYYILSSFPASIVGPFAYLYCQSIMVGKQVVLRFKSFLHFLPSTLFLLYLMCFELSIVGTTTNDFLSETGNFPNYMNSFIYFYTPAYYFYTWLSCRRFARKIQSNSEFDILKFKHARSFSLCINVFLWTFYIFKITSGFFDQITFAGLAIAPFILLMMFVFVLITALKNNPVFNLNSNIEKEKLKSFVPELSEELTLQIETGLKVAFEKHKVYMDKDLNLKKLSDLIHVNPRYISQYVNVKYQKNFNDFINEFRVEESKNMLLNPEFENLKLEAIGEKAGFNSRASFFSNFKKITGQTPASYKKEKYPEIL